MEHCKLQSTLELRVISLGTDKDGAQIDTAFDNVSGIKEDGVWKFEAMILEGDVDSGKFDYID